MKNWKLLLKFSLIGLISVCSNAIYGQTTYYSQTSSNPKTFSNWNTIPTGGGSSPSSFSSNNQIFTIQSGHNMTVGSGGNWSVSGTGSKVVISSSGILTTASGAGFAGTLDMQSTGKIVAGGGSIAGIVFGVVTSDAVFEYTSGSAVFNGTYPCSVLISAGNINFGGGSQTFQSDVTVSGGSIRFASGSSVTHSIAGNLSVQAGGTYTATTGSGIPTINFTGSNKTIDIQGIISSADHIININGNYTLNSDFSITGTTRTFTVNGTLNLSNNVLSGSGRFTLSSGANIITSNSSGISSSITTSGTKIFNNGANYEFQGASTGTFTVVSVNNLTFNNSGGTVALAKSFVVTGAASVTTGTTLDCGGSFTISGAGSFTLSSNATIVTANSSGISGSITTTGKTFNSGANYEFQGASTGTFTVASVNNMTFNTSGTVAVGQSFTVTGAAAVTSGTTIDIGASVLSGTGTFTLASSATLKTANTSGILGSIAVAGTKTFTAGANYEFLAPTTTAFPTTAQVATFGNANNVTTNSDITLNRNIQVNGTLSIAGAKVTLGSNSLTIGNVGIITGVTSSSYIVTDGSGKLKRNNVGNTTVSFPIGDVSTYAPVTLFNSGTGDHFSVGFSQTAPICFNPTQQISAVTGTWDISEDDPGQSNCTISIDVANVATGGSFNLSQAEIAHCNGFNIDYLDGSASGSIITGSGFTSFSPFGVWSQSALPVELAYFRATPADGKTVLDWRTYSENNNSHFSIEKSTDGKQYKEIGQIAGKGTTTEVNDYNIEDENPAPGINYYRLKQLDFDGKFEYSKVISVNFGGGKGEVLLYPTVASSEVHIRFPTLTESAGFVHIFDLNGRLVKQLAFESEMDGLSLPTDDLQSGQYLVKVQNGQVFEVLRFVKQ